METIWYCRRCDEFIIRFEDDDPKPCKTCGKFPQLSCNEELESAMESSEEDD